MAHPAYGLERCSFFSMPPYEGHCRKLKAIAPAFLGSTHIDFLGKFVSPTANPAPENSIYSGIALSRCVALWLVLLRWGCRFVGMIPDLKSLWTASHRDSFA